MHVPNKFKETNKDVLQNLIRSHPLGTWIISVDDELDVNHIPFVLDSTQGEFGVLKGHVNIANPVWKSLPTATSSAIVFQGAETYITPSWYASKQEHGKVVPTWNYAVVHAHGRANIVRDRNWLFEHLNALSDQQEEKQPEPWKVADAPKEFTDKMINGIVGIEIPISALVGAWKTSQNKNQSDRAGIINGLSNSENSQSTEMASYIAHQGRN